MATATFYQPFSYINDTVQQFYLTDSQSQCAACNGLLNNLRIVQTVTLIRCVYVGNHGNIHDWTSGMSNPPRPDYLEVTLDVPSSPAKFYYPFHFIHNTLEFFFTKDVHAQNESMKTALSGIAFPQTVTNVRCIYLDGNKNIFEWLQPVTGNGPSVPDYIEATFTF